MKRTEVLRTDASLYLNYGNYKHARIATLLGERLKKIIFDNGPNISFSIEAVKHEMSPDDGKPFPFPVVNGLVHCRIVDENVFLIPEEALAILQNDWCDYRITYETNKEKKE